MTTIIKGTLIRVTTDSAIVGKEQADANGVLWVVERHSPVGGGNTVYAKSLATGFRYVWLGGEYEIAEGD